MKNGKTGRRLTQAERRQLTRRALLDAAARRFARDGYRGASLEDIAADAGLTKGALYYNFAGREALFLALLDEHVEARIALLRGLHGTGPEALREAAERMARALRRDRDWGLLFFELSAEAARDPGVRRRFNRRMAPFRAALAEAVAQRAPAGADAAALAAAAEALMDGHAMGALLRPGSGAGEALAQSLELLWRGAG